MLRNPSLFIASSGQARFLAQELASALRDGGFEAEAWTSHRAFPSGKHLLTSLLDLSRQRDFAVVLLTGDDLKEELGGGKRRGAGTKTLVPRANCIFELGLFMGAFGTPERCLLLVEKRAEASLQLLSDIGGLKYDTFPNGKLGRHAHRDETRKRMYRMVRTMTRKGRFLERPRLPMLTTEELLEREGSVALRKHATVVVKENQPLEFDLRYGRVVWDNIKRRRISYQYLFDFDDANLRNVALMLRAILAASILRKSLYPHYRAWTEDAIQTRLRGRAGEVMKNLEELRKRLYIRLEGDLPPDEFCIHSAADERHRVGYVKVQGGYTPAWAAQTEDRYETYYEPADKWPRETIFKPNSLRARRRRLFEARVGDSFPENLHDAVLGACLGQKPPSAVSAGDRLKRITHRLSV